MKFLITIIFILSLTFFANAQKNADSLQNAFNPEVETAIFFKNKTIVFNTKDSINPDFEIKNGKELVFQYELKYKEYVMIMDDENVERLYFKVLPKGNKFTYNIKNFKKSHLLYNQSCFCMDAGNYVIQRGKIVGTKINKSTWSVQIHFSYTTRNSKFLIAKKFKVKFKIATQNDN